MKAFSIRRREPVPLKVNLLDHAEISKILAETFVKIGLSRDIKVLRHRPMVPDGTPIYLVGRKPRQAVLLLSPADFPFVVSDERARASAMRNYLQPDLGATILTSLAEGNIMGRSYALLPFRRPLSNNRVWWKVQRRFVKRDLIDWSQELISKHNAALDATRVATIFVEPLRHLHSLNGIDSAIQAIATDSIERLQAGNFRPRVAPMHNDLWKGNILLTRRSELTTDQRYPFSIIDWRGSRTDGFPFFDLIRLSMSFALPPDELKREIIFMSEQIGCDLSDVRTYLAAALGELSMRLEQFPLQHFLKMASACFSELRKVGS